MKVVALAGGVGGAKLAYGLAHVLPPSDLTLIVNTADDFEHFGLYICPDLDTICYTLAGIANPETGWGQMDESWNAMHSIKSLGGPDWFRLGDKDLGTHLERTRRLALGISLSTITHDFCRAWGIQVRVLPMSDDPIRTIIQTEIGDLPFQEYFVQHRCEPRIRGILFSGIQEACPGPGVIEAILESDLVIFCPSNPWVSIDPILAVPGIRSALVEKAVIAVSPIIAGKAIKGPAAKMFSELDIQPSAYAVAEHYQASTAGGLLIGFVLDDRDSNQAPQLIELGLKPFFTNTLMESPSDRIRLATEVLEFARGLIFEKVKR